MILEFNLRTQFDEIKAYEVEGRRVIPIKIEHIIEYNKYNRNTKTVNTKKVVIQLKSFKKYIIIKREKIFGRYVIRVMLIKTNYRTIEKYDVKNCDEEFKFALRVLSQKYPELSKFL